MKNLKQIQLLRICNKNLKITKCNKHLAEAEKTFCSSVCEDYLTEKLCAKNAQMMGKFRFFNR